jgi:hypothetical protein
MQIADAQMGIAFSHRQTTMSEQLCDISKWRPRLQ